MVIAGLKMNLSFGFLCIKGLLSTNIEVVFT